MVLKCGSIAAAIMADANASIPELPPEYYRPFLPPLHARRQAAPWPL
jgi:urease alpha subunit